MFRIESCPQGPSGAVLRIVALDGGFIGHTPVGGSTAPRVPRPPILSYHAATVAFQRALLRQALAQAQRLQRTYVHRLRKSLGLR